MSVEPSSAIQILVETLMHKTTATILPTTIVTTLCYCIITADWGMFYKLLDVLLDMSITSPAMTSCENANTVIGAAILKSGHPYKWVTLPRVHNIYIYIIYLFIYLFIIMHVNKDTGCLCLTAQKSPAVSVTCCLLI